VLHWEWSSQSRRWLVPAIQTATQNFLSNCFDRLVLPYLSVHKSMKCDIWKIVLFFCNFSSIICWSCRSIWNDALCRFPPCFVFFCRCSMLITTVVIFNQSHYRFFDRILQSIIMLVFGRSLTLVCSRPSIAACVVILRTLTLMVGHGWAGCWPCDFARLLFELRRCPRLSFGSRLKPKRKGGTLQVHHGLAKVCWMCVDQNHNPTGKNRKRTVREP
jgi:hypothetical protein